MSFDVVYQFVCWYFEFCFVVTNMSSFNSLTVKVERVTDNPRSPLIKLFEKRIELDSNVFVPFEHLSESLRFLYGNGVIVSFSSQIINYKNK